MKTKIAISVIVVIATMLYFKSITTAPFDHSINFSQMPWDETKYYITYIMIMCAGLFGLLPWVPYLIKKYFNQYT